TSPLTLNNNGPDPATNVALADLLPAGLTFVSATASQGTYDDAAGLWTVGTVTPETPQTLQIQAQVTSPDAQTNTARISAADQFDPSTGNNQASATETPQRADLAPTKTVPNGRPNGGDPITFTIPLPGQGPDAATNVSVQDLLPAGLTLVSAPPSQGSYTPATGVWTVGTVNPAT